jgi:hypothetical protein
MLQIIIISIIIIIASINTASGRDRGGNRNIIKNDPTTFGSPVPKTPNYDNRIPSPLPSPSVAPTVNGPVSQPALRGLKGIGQ